MQFTRSAKDKLFSFHVRGNEEEIQKIKTVVDQLNELTEEYNQKYTPSKKKHVTKEERLTQKIIDKIRNGET